MTGASPKMPSLATMRALLEAARETGSHQAVTLELCLLTLCLPWEAVEVDLERIDWRAGTTEVAARGGRTRTLVLTTAAQKTILRVAGSAGGKGQFVTAGRGRPLDARDVRIDRLKNALARSAAGAGIADGWNFHGIRAAAATELLFKQRVERDDILAALGRHDRVPLNVFLPRAYRKERARHALEIWNRLLLDGG